MTTKKKEVETKNPVIISQDHLREIDKVEHNAQLKTLELSIARLKVEKADKELSLLSANYTLKSKEKVELLERVTELDRELTESKNSYKNLMSEIATTYSLPEKFGYDHITGEVK
jgi:hypothetical protein